MTTELIKEFNEPATDEKIPVELPVLPLRDLVVFPSTLYPILAGRESSIKAINKALESNKYILVVTQIDPSVEEATSDSLYKVGTIAKILQVLKLPNNLVKVLVDGIVAAKVLSYHRNDYLTAKVEIISSEIKEDSELIGLVRQLNKQFTEYVNSNTNGNIPKDALVVFENILEPHKKLFYVASSLNIDIPKKQKILELSDLKKQYYEILYLLNLELQILNIEKEIENKVQAEMQKNQRKFIVQEQIRILQNELEEGVETDPDLLRIKEAIESSGMPEAIKKKAFEEYDKLKRTPQMSPDFSVIRNYLDWMINVPWDTFTEDNYDLENARKILDEDHYDLEKPKERILELIAVLRKLKSKNIKKPPKGQILCFVGPPGVGKTSLGKSIARALNRKFTRLSVGGVRDEAEIRGHRRTYIGSMPGKIIQAMRKTGTCNPVILIDEIDKMGNDFRGDPASAMLEVLDPEQNSTFNDHYLDVDYDLSNVLFITTANVQYSIPLPLQDRMEIIEMRSYLDFEKVQIAKRHIIPKEMAEHGLEPNEIVFSDKIILDIISLYTKEAGVRNLERELSSIIRKITKDYLAEGPRKVPVRVTPKMVEKYLGVPRYEKSEIEKSESYRIGSVYGLAWTSMGGELLDVDVTLMKGNSKLILTGMLGDVMKESAQAGLSYIRANARQFGISEGFFKDKEVHIHLPEGAIPKDGPSAGITMVMAMLSAFTKVPVHTDVAMTGEITLRGRVLPIGGLNEKLLAALRGGIKTVIIPKDNERHLSETPQEITSRLKIVCVRTVEEAFKYVFKGNILKKRKNV
ncbi:MAG: endopeptidase La [Ignavibacteria bacterium]